MKNLFIAASTFLVPLCSFALETPESLSLNGTYTSTCNFAKSIFEDGFATKSAMTFVNNTLTLQTWWYSDSLCLNEVLDRKSEVSTPGTFTDGEFAGIFGAGTVSGQPYYKSIFEYKNEETNEKEKVEVCFALYTSNLLDKKEVLYMGFHYPEDPGTCSLDFDTAWIK